MRGTFMPGRFLVAVASKSLLALFHISSVVAILIAPVCCLSREIRGGKDSQAREARAATIVTMLRFGRPCRPKRTAPSLAAAAAAPASPGVVAARPAAP